MTKQRKITRLLFFTGMLLFIAFGYAFGAMKIHLKNGMVVTVSVNRDDIVSINFEETDQTGAGRLIETVIIPNDKAVKVTSVTSLEKGKWYIIEASGVISDWSQANEGVDAVWCYAEWRCGKNGEVWNQLRINEKGLPDIAGKSIPYNPQHVYQVRYLGEGKTIELYCSDTQGSWSDNSGSFTVKIFQQ